VSKKVWPILRGWARVSRDSEDRYVDVRECSCARSGTNPAGVSRRAIVWNFDDCDEKTGPNPRACWEFAGLKQLWVRGILSQLKNGACWGCGHDLPASHSHHSCDSHSEGLPTKRANLLRGIAESCNSFSRCWEVSLDSAEQQQGEEKIICDYAGCAR